MKVVGQVRAVTVLREKQMKGEKGEMELTQTTSPNASRIITSHSRIASFVFVYSAMLPQCKEAAYVTDKQQQSLLDNKNSFTHSFIGACFA
jgi:topoisomerase IA-like protein